MDIEELRKKYGQTSGEPPSPPEEEDEELEKDEDGNYIFFIFHELIITKLC